MTNLIPPSARSQLAILACCLTLGMIPWFSATAIVPVLSQLYSLSPTATAWITMAVQLGFVIGTFTSTLFMLSDHWSARRLAAASSVVAGITTIMIPFANNSVSSVILLRVFTGIALAGVYPPSMKIVAGWWRNERGLALGILIGALTIGSGGPHLLRNFIRPDEWYILLWVSGAAAILAGGLFQFAVREGPHHAPSVPFNITAIRDVISNRGVALVTIGYLGHMWELYAMWTSIAGFWIYIIVQRSLPVSVAYNLAFATIAIGAIGCVLGGVIADRMGRAAVAIGAMIMSAACALTIGFTIEAPMILVVSIAFIWGITVVADSAQFSACIIEVAPQHYIGTALTLQTCLGFLLTLVTIQLTPVWIEQFGWEHTFKLLAIGPILGCIAMWRYHLQAKQLHD